MIKEAAFTGKLLAHQQEALDKLDATDAMLLFHTLGAGKTATSIAGSEDYDSDVVVPASLRENYKKEIRKFTKDPSKRDVMSYQRFTKEGPSFGSKVLVMDEAQRIGRNESQMSQNAIDSAKFYDKRILLSGTPALNSPRELAPIIRMLTPEATYIPIDAAAFNKKFIGEEKIPVSFWNKLKGVKPGVNFKPINVQDIKDAISGKVHYYKSTKKDYPERIDEIKEVEASEEQANIYKYVTNSADPVIAMKVRMNLPLSKKELRQINAFMGAARQVSNTSEAYGGKEQVSNKIKEIINDVKDGIKKNKKHKSLIYSNYIKSGIDEVEAGLIKEDIPYATFTGKMNDRSKKKAVDDYNSGKVKALLVSSSGSEGIDLKGTRSIHIVEPHWNKNRIEQVIGRGIRYKSHSDLPKKERKVKVIKYHTVMPKTKMQKLLNKPADTSADQYLENLSNQKQDLLDKYLDILKEEGSNMNKQAFLEETYNSSFNDELEKIAVSAKTIISSGRKALVKSVKSKGSTALDYGATRRNVRAIAASNLSKERSLLNDYITDARKKIDKGDLREHVQNLLSESRIAAKAAPKKRQLPPYVLPKNTEFSKMIKKVRKNARAYNRSITV